MTFPSYLQRTTPKGEYNRLMFLMYDCAYQNLFRSLLFALDRNSVGSWNLFVVVYTPLVYSSEGDYKVQESALPSAVGRCDVKTFKCWSTG